MNISKSVNSCFLINKLFLKVGHPGVSSGGLGPKPKKSNPQSSKLKSNLTPGEIEAIKALRADPNIPEDAKPHYPKDTNVKATESPHTLGGLLHLITPYF